MIRRSTLLAAAALACAALPATASADLVMGRTTPQLRANGIGPLKLGMTTAAALRTRWLAHRGSGCELGGRPYPVTYQLSGPSAPGGVVGSAEFNRGKLTNLSFTKGVETTFGARVGTTTARGMVNRAKDAGFGAAADYVDTFEGTFVAVVRGKTQFFGGFARGRASARKPISILAIPNVPVCE
ncbi:hypothetical protein Q5424_28125 [Conexibacter sp. JD483]|uniref:hypothetical protein n=1 Tax=unclassified Conexibacter TaxID=2627773 RepID=UPI002719CEF9|nr:MULTISPECIES: hypothetical protein [unclassified Conexibacter]MDO8189287.1 hypothetical protein [Conexibacter sp. CPCC 205706]MDO8201965.1 hypothetical protein [Conexibacter sp. CPCC 205762]MDR9372997.1 hypothetical protein [Conexibacter sp. JD483]